MFREIKSENRYVAYNGDDEICVIESLGDNKYHAHNNECDIVAEIIPIDDYKTQLSLISHKRRGKNGKYRKSNKLAEHNLFWLNYMLQQKGFIRMQKATH